MPDNNQVFKEVKDHSNLFDFVTDKSGDSKPKKAGAATQFNGCPLCDANDAFTITNKEPDLFFCYSCGVGGDIFTFAEKLLGLSKGDALKEVAQHAKVDIEKYKSNSKPKPINKLQEVLRAAAKHYQANLQANPKALQWLTRDKPEGRGHTAKTIEKLEIGFSDGKMAEALQEQGFTLDQIKQSGLYVQHKERKDNWYDYFGAGLAIFPHRLPNGDIGHFTVKDPEKKRKFQLKAEHRFNDFYFANQRAIRNNEIIIVEGENDLASCFDIDLVNTMACIGQLSDAQIQWLAKNASGKTFYFWFDNDTKWKKGKPPAGVKYTRKLYQSLLKNPNCTIYVLSALMDQGEDPDDFIQKDKNNAKERVDHLKRFAMHPLVWEVAAMPSDIRNNLEAAERYLQDIKIFEYMGLVPNIKRTAIIKELEKIGFHHESIHSEIKEVYQLRKDLDEYRGSVDPQTQKSERFQRQFATKVWDYLNEHGKFFVSPGDNLNLFYKHEIYRIGDGNAWMALLNQEAGLNSTTAIYKFTTAEIKALCQVRSDRLDSFSWIHRQGEAKNIQLYYNLKDPYNRIVKVTSNEIKLLDNGTNQEKVLLSESTNLAPFQYQDAVNIEQAMGYLKTYVLKSLTCHPAQAYYVLAHSLSSFLLPLVKAKSILKLEGGSQSAKTSSARACGYLLYGKDMIGAMSTASAYSMAATEPMLIFDNLENADVTKEVLNFLLLVSTGASRFKRTSGSDTDVTSEMLNTLVTCTGIEPFAKPELINRTVIIQCDRKQWGNIEHTDSLVSEKIIEHRDEIISAWLVLLSKEVIPALNESNNILHYLRTQHKDHSKERMDEHTTLLVLITRSILRYIPLPEIMQKEAENKPHEYYLLDQWVKYQNQEASKTEQGTNPILQLLEGVRNVYLQEFYRNKSNPQAHDGGPARLDTECRPSMLQVNVYRTAVASKDLETPRFRYHFNCSTGELLAIFQRYCREHSIKCGFVNARQLGVRIKNDKKVLTQSGWTIKTAKKVQGTRLNQYAWEG